jgi:hypothetical protein
MGKVGMSVLTKGLAMDFEREGRTSMAITSIWPAVVRAAGVFLHFLGVCLRCCALRTDFPHLF